MMFTSAKVLTMSLLASSATIGSSAESTQQLHSFSVALEDVASSSAELTQNLHSVTAVTSKDVTSTHDDATTLGAPHILKKKAKGSTVKMPKGPKAPKSTKKPKTPKSRKKPKSSKTSEPESPSSAPSSPPTEDPCGHIITQKDALLALKAGIMDGGTVLSDWDIESDPCDDDWTGVTCSIDAEVTDIGLDYYLLEGTISPLIGCPTTLVSSLTILDFYASNLSGTIPTELAALTGLTDLIFYGSSLSGTIPRELGALTNLEFLDFSYNKLNGTIPKAFGALTNLEFLDFSYNKLNGTIPKELGALTNLTYLYFSQNDLKGSMPTGICTLRSPDGAMLSLTADHCGASPEVECTCCTNSCA